MRRTMKALGSLELQTCEENYSRKGAEDEGQIGQLDSD